MELHDAACCLWPQADWGPVEEHSNSVFSLCHTLTAFREDKSSSFMFPSFTPPPHTPKTPINSYIEPLCLQDSQKNLSIVVCGSPGEEISLNGCAKFQLLL